MWKFLILGLKFLFIWQKILFTWFVRGSFSSLLFIHKNKSANHGEFTWQVIREIGHFGGDDLCTENNSNSTTCKTDLNS